MRQPSLGTKGSPHGLPFPFECYPNRMQFRFGLFPLALALVYGMSAPLIAQKVQQVPTSLPHTRPVPVLRPAQPFAIDTPAAALDSAVRFVTADTMTQPDKLLAANYESSVAEAAARQGFDLNSGRWSYQQIVCPALPGHLFLRYTRNAGVGDVTLFSASVPCGNEGRVRIVPILKRSYSLFSPAPINALTISAFNHIRAEEEPAQRTQGWLGNGLCYAALAGGNPQIEPSSGIMTTANGGGEEIRFVDMSASRKSGMWSMTFARSGKLMKASLSPARLESFKPVPQGKTPSTRLVPQEAELRSHPVPAGKPPATRPVPQKDAAVKTWTAPKN